ncbi:alcohol dehydrogenase catalytic domain-containing protein [uncultured Lactobacillus sp.]|uniref:alcohol dehydrogenase catalytic domain-containing protein n=1 Tax=uncultured Lactobacillus sp. TaxID=153152 RepID=UPI0025982705|nr:alcohol dehydrogenase catalytic domain-containing protein [uncultured Lactobacillus sp.]
MQEAKLIKYDSKNPIIKLTTAEAKAVGDHDLLIESKVAAVNPLDNLLAHGDLKLVVPYKLPQTLGNEFVGIVKQAGSAVKKFQAGDRVYARTPLDNMGAFAEEIVISEQAVAKVPDYLTDEEAAAVPLTARPVKFLKA